MQAGAAAAPHQAQCTLDPSPAANPRLPAPEGAIWLYAAAIDARKGACAAASAGSSCLLQSSISAWFEDRKCTAAACCNWKDRMPNARALHSQLAAAVWACPQHFDRCPKIGSFTLSVLLCKVRHKQSRKQAEMRASIGRESVHYIASEGDWAPDMTESGKNRINRMARRAAACGAGRNDKKATERTQGAGCRGRHAMNSADERLARRCMRRAAQDCWRGLGWREVALLKGTGIAVLDRRAGELKHRHAVPVCGQRAQAALPSSTRTGWRRREAVAPKPRCSALLPSTWQGPRPRGARGDGAHARCSASALAASCAKISPALSGRRPASACMRAAGSPDATAARGRRAGQPWLGNECCRLSKQAPCLHARGCVDVPLRQLGTANQKRPAAGRGGRALACGSRNPCGT